MDDMSTLSIPEDWTPKQAQAVYEIASTLAQSVWELCDRQLIGIYRHELLGNPSVDPDNEAEETNP